MKNKRIFLRVLLIIICILYVLFLYIDIFNIQDFISSNTLKYISIILCFLITLFIGKDSFNKKDKFLLQAGFFVTVFADLYLLIYDYYILGITLFCIVQIIYYIRYKGYRSYSDFFAIFRFIIIFLLIMSIYMILNLFAIKVDFLYVMAFLYSICLIFSTMEAIKVFKNNLYPFSNKHMIFWGMVLFLLCDINVAVSNIINGYFSSLYNISSLLIWSFYLPSQVLLSISGYKFK